MCPIIHVAEPNCDSLNVRHASEIDCDLRAAHAEAAYGTSKVLAPPWTFRENALCATGAQALVEIEIVSTRQLTLFPLLAVPIRNRSLIVCPATFGPRFATVSI